MYFLSRAGFFDGLLCFYCVLRFVQRTQRSGGFLDNKPTCYTHFLYKIRAFACVQIVAVP